VSSSFDVQRQIRTTTLRAIFLACMGITAACGPSRNAKLGNAEAKVTSEAKDTGVRRYTLTGRVVSIDKAARSISVDGDEIPGFMAAMTMPYQVKEAAALEQLSPGDQIKAEIVVGNEGAYLENIVLVQKSGFAELNKVSPVIAIFLAPPIVLHCPASDPKRTP
jgi:protein SCO1/2